MFCTRNLNKDRRKVHENERNQLMRQYRMEMFSDQEQYDLLLGHEMMPNNHQY